MPAMKLTRNQATRMATTECSASQPTLKNSSRNPTTASAAHCTSFSARNNHFRYTKPSGYPQFTLASHLLSPTSRREIPANKEAMRRIAGSATPIASAIICVTILPPPASKVCPGACSLSNNFSSSATTNQSAILAPSRVAAKREDNTWTA